MTRSMLAVSPAALLAVLAAAALRSPAPPDPAPLLGRRASELAALLPPPARIVGPSSSRWIWGERGAGASALHVVDGRVVHVDPGFDPGALPRPDAPPEAPFLGQPVEELLAALGPADGLRWLPSAGAAPGPVPRPGEATAPPRPCLVWGKVWVQISGGVVVGVGPPVTAVTSGPR